MDSLKWKLADEQKSVESKKWDISFHMRFRHLPTTQKCSSYKCVGVVFFWTAFQQPHSLKLLIINCRFRISEGHEGLPLICSYSNPTSRFVQKLFRSFRTHHIISISRQRKQEDRTHHLHLSDEDHVMRQTIQNTKVLEPGLFSQVKNQLD